MLSLRGARSATKQSLPHGRPGVTRDCFAEPVIGPAKGRTRWLAMTPCSIRPGAFDHALELGVLAALGVAAQRLHLSEIFLGLEQIALLGVPHAVIRPGDGVGRIGGERPLVPDLGVVVAAELAAGI